MRKWIFDIISPKEWLYASICFGVGLIILYDYSLNNSISNYIMFPIDLLGAASFYLFYQSLNERKDQKMEYR